MGFIEERRQRAGPLWERMLRHPFLLRTRDGTLPDETFARWMRQDYLFVDAAVPFLAGLLARAPVAHREPLTEAIAALHRELELFRERARAAGVPLDGVEPSFICHAYIQFLLATAARASYAEAFTVLYVAEAAYHESWRVVRAGIDPDSPWLPFVENWAGEAFAAYVAWLREETDALAASAGEEERRRMGRLFDLTLRYEIAFWEMAVTGEAWPGIDGEGMAGGEAGTGRETEDGGAAADGDTG